MTDFTKTFEQLTGHAPFPWQTALYERLLRGDFPSHCNLPTGRRGENPDQVPPERKV